VTHLVLLRHLRHLQYIEAVTIEQVLSDYIPTRTYRPKVRRKIRVVPLQREQYGADWADIADRLKKMNCTLEFSVSSGGDGTKVPNVGIPDASGVFISHLDGFD
jgi:hypothetical protein